MTSLLCVQQPGGTLEVYDPELVQELIIDSNDHIKTMYMDKTASQARRTKMKRPQSSPHPGRPSDVTSHVDSSVLIDHTLRLQQWLNDKHVESIQQKTDSDVRETKTMYDSVLEREETFVKDVKESLMEKDMFNTRRKEMLHKKWSERVHEPLRKQIDQEMNGPMYDELMKRKRELHKEYLEHVNRKGHVFLDTIAPEEYYPLSLHPVRPSLLMAKTKKLRDPLLSQERERTSEERIEFRCMTGSYVSDKEMDQIRLPPLPLVPLGRHGTECKTWLQMPEGDIESPVRRASRRRMNSNYNQSFNFEHYWSTPLVPHMSDDLRLQKKRMYRQHSGISTIHSTPPRSPETTNVAIQVGS